MHYFLNGPTLVGSKLVVIAVVDVMLWTYRNVSTLSLCVHDQLRALVLLNDVLNTFPQIPTISFPPSFLGMTRINSSQPRAPNLKTSLQIVTSTNTDLFAVNQRSHPHRMYYRARYICTRAVNSHVSLSSFPLALGRDLDLEDRQKPRDVQAALSAM